MTISLLHVRTININDRYTDALTDMLSSYYDQHQRYTGPRSSVPGDGPETTSGLRPRLDLRNDSTAHY